MCVNTEFNGMMFAPLSWGSLQRVNTSLFYQFLAWELSSLEGNLADLSPHVCISQHKGEIRGPCHMGVISIF